MSEEQTLARVSTDNAAEKVTASWLHVLLLLATAALVSYQFSSLYSTPRPDCDRWHGDETWLMREFTTQITTGIMRYPEAIGATIGDRNTFPLTSMWLNAVVYGLPVALLQSHASIVDIGRAVTAVLSVILLAAMYWCSIRVGVRKEWAAFGLLTLVATRAFFLSTHCARYDIWVGLGVLLAWYVTIRFSELRTTWFVVGLALPVMLSWNVHVLRTAGVLWVFLIVCNQAWKHVLPIAAGVLSGFAVLALLYIIFSGNIILSDVHAGGSQFNQVTHNIPMLHPFAPRLQWANVVIRFEQLWDEAFFLLIVLLIAFVIAIVRSIRTHRLSPAAIATMLVLIAWAVTMWSPPYYSVHILPVLAVAAMFVLSKLRTSAVTSVVIALAAILMIVYSIRDVNVAQSNGELATGSSSRIAAEVKRDILQRQTKPVVMAEIPLLSYFIQDTSLHFIVPYFLIFPKDSTTPPQFLRQHHVQFVAVEGTRLTLPSGFALTGKGYDADSIGTMIGRYTGYFNDNYRSYFAPFQPLEDTLSLFEIKAQ